jgi:phosphatidylserine decarboxylase
MFTRRTLMEGIGPMLVLAGLALISLWLRWWPVAVIVLAVFAFTLSFFRDPPRTIPADPKTIVAPADGRIVEIKPTGAGTMIAIFLSVFDVHVQRAPVAGTIRSVHYQPGQFLDARNPQAGPRNERRVIQIETDDGWRVEVRQIAGLIARRIVGWVGEGARVAKG